MEQQIVEEQIKAVWFEEGSIKIQTSKDAVMSMPLEVFPALFCATPTQREKFYLWDDNRSIRWEELDEDIHISHFYEPETVNYDNDVNRLLSRFPWLDMKAFAEFLGMHWTKLARFRYGVWTPSPETFAKIRNGIIAIGKEMSAAAL